MRKAYLVTFTEQVVIDFEKYLADENPNINMKRFRKI